MSNAIQRKREAEAEAKEKARAEDEAIRAYLASIPDSRPSDSRGGASWNGKFKFGSAE
jgi:hypothetical protein